MMRAKIENIETLAVTVPTLPFQTTKTVRAGSGPINKLDFVFVRIRAGDGLVGLGECVQMLSLSGQTVEGVRAVIGRHLAPKIIGMSPFDVERVGLVVDRAMPNAGPIKASIDMALHDLMGKILGVPVHALIGGKVRDKIEVAAEVSTWSDVERTAANACELKAQNFVTLKLKLGGNPVGDAAVLHAVRDAVGMDVQLRVDANQGWSFKEAITFHRLTRDCGLAYIEQPLARADLAGMAALVRTLEIPIAADEAIIGVEDAQRIFSARAADLLVIKPGKNGGITDCRVIAKWANGCTVPLVIGTDFSLGVGIAAKLHLAASLPRLFGPTEFSELGLFGPDVGQRLLGNRRFDIIDHSLEVPDDPGLGVDLDYDMVREFSYTE